MGLKQSNRYNEGNGERGTKPMSKDNNLSSNLLNNDENILKDEPLSKYEVDNNLTSTHIDNDQYIGTDESFSSNEFQYISSDNCLNR